jgi:hypothetical protein
LEYRRRQIASWDKKKALRVSAAAPEVSVGRHAERLLFLNTTEAVALAASPIRVSAQTSLGPKKMLKNGLHWVTANRGKPDASDLGAAGFRRDRLRPNE